MKRISIIASVLLPIALAACQNADNSGMPQPEQAAAPAAPPEQAPPQPAHETNVTGERMAASPSTSVTLFQGMSLEGWEQVGDANWHLVDGYVEADSGAGFLVTPGAYSDFNLRVEFWTDEPANSGVFIRCSNAEEPSADNCYEVNIYDRRPDQTYRTGAIVNVAEPMTQVDAANQWNTYEIRAEGSHLTVRLNGMLTVDTQDGKHASGPIGLQYGAGVDGKGVVRFRNVQLTPL
jgi:3-keto-disaccharide hydrolase